MPMKKALDRTVATEAREAGDWRKRMSDTVAYSLLVYTGLHIFVTVGAIQQTGAKMLALFALVVLVFGVIPLWRWFEKRWAVLTDEQAQDPAFGHAYRRDQFLVWVLAIGLPIGLTLVVKALFALS